MPLAIAAFGVLILLSFSGGLALSQDVDPSEERVILSTEEAQTQTQAQTKMEEPRSISSNRLSRSSARQSRSTSKLTEEKVVDFRIPIVETAQPQNIEGRSADFRGQVNMYSQKDGTVFAVYGYNARDVSSITNQYISFDKIPELNNDRVRVTLIDRRAAGIKEYSRRVSGLVPDTVYYFKLCVEHNTLFNTKKITCGATRSFSTNPSSGRSNNFNESRVSLYSALNITAYEAILGGEVRMNDGVNGIVFFTYGESESRIRAVENFSKYSSVREDDEDLQKVRVGANVRGNAEYEYKIDDLDRGTKYYYRICVEYDGERDGLVCSSVRNFTTDSRDRSSIPFAETKTPVRVGNQIRLGGLIEMNDFFDGIAFFAFGTDETKINNVSSSNSFSGIRQYGDELQRILLDSDADGNNDYSKTLDYLKSGTKYFYRICVEYEAEDERNRVDTFLRCGLVKSFTTL